MPDPGPVAEFEGGPCAGSGIVVNDAQPQHGEFTVWRNAIDRIDIPFMQPGEQSGVDTGSDDVAPGAQLKLRLSHETAHTARWPSKPPRLRRTSGRGANGPCTLHRRKMPRPPLRLGIVHRWRKRRQPAHLYQQCRLSRSLCLRPAPGRRRSAARQRCEALSPLRPVPRLSRLRSRDRRRFNGPAGPHPRPGIRRPQHSHDRASRLAAANADAARYARRGIVVYDNNRVAIKVTAKTTACSSSPTSTSTAGKRPSTACRHPSTRQPLRPRRPSPPANTKLSSPSPPAHS